MQIWGLSSIIIQPFFDGKEKNHARFDLRQSISTQAAYQIFRDSSRKLFVNLTSAAGSDSLVHQWLQVVISVTAQTKEVLIWHRRMPIPIRIRRCLFADGD
jgi:hypothetical protein